MNGLLNNQITQTIRDIHMNENFIYEGPLLTDKRTVLEAQEPIVYSSSTKEIKDLLCYLRLINNYKDDVSLLLGRKGACKVPSDGEEMAFLCLYSPDMDDLLAHGRIYNVGGTFS